MGHSQSPRGSQRLQHRDARRPPRRAVDRSRGRVPACARAPRRRSRVLLRGGHSRVRIALRRRSSLARCAGGETCGGCSARCGSRRSLRFMVTPPAADSRWRCSATSVIAATNAILSLPETGLGMIPGVVGTQSAPRAIGVGRTLDMVLTGRRIDAREACRVGLVGSVVSAGPPRGGGEPAGAPRW